MRAGNRIERPARRRVVDPLHEPRLRQAPLSSPQPSPGQRIRSTPTTEPSGPDQAGVHERDILGPQPRSSTHMPGRMPASANIIRVARLDVSLSVTADVLEGFVGRCTG